MSPKKKTKRLSDQLRQRIEVSELSRYRIGKLAEVDQAVLCKFVAGERGISTETWDRLGGVLGLRLVAEEESKPRKKGK